MRKFITSLLVVVFVTYSFAGAMLSVHLGEEGEDVTCPPLHQTWQRLAESLVTLRVCEQDEFFDADSDDAYNLVVNVENVRAAVLRLGRAGIQAGVNSSQHTIHGNQEAAMQQDARLIAAQKYATLAWCKIVIGLGLERSLTHKRVVGLLAQITLPASVDLQELCKTCYTMIACQEPLFEQLRQQQAKAKRQQKRERERQRRKAYEDRRRELSDDEQAAQTSVTKRFKRARTNLRQQFNDVASQSLSQRGHEAEGEDSEG